MLWQVLDPTCRGVGEKLPSGGRQEVPHSPVGGDVSHRLGSHQQRGGRVVFLSEHKMDWGCNTCSENLGTHSPEELEDYGRHRTGLQGWRKGFSDTAKSRSMTGN